MKLKLPMGRSLNMAIEKTQVTPDIIRQSQDLLKKYITYMDPIHSKMIESEQWYKSLHWEYIRNEKYKDDPEPTTAFVLSTIENKHADAMDYYPTCNLRPRDPADVEESKRLSEIIPVELEWNDFMDTWDRCWYDKLKLGSGIYAVLFDPKGNGGIGTNVVKSIDPLRFYCNPHIAKLSESKGVFIVELIDKDDFKRQFPDASIERAGKLFEPKQYITSNQQDTADMILIIDHYYLAENQNGETVCHYVKFAGDEKLYWSEESPDYSDGYYKIDQYPFEIDTMYPEKDNIFGFGVIDVVKNPQIYIDKLDQIILANTAAHSRKRFFVTEAFGANEADMLDPSIPFIKVNTLNENAMKEFKTDPTDSLVPAHRQVKVDELKDTSSTNEFSRGETGGGVTAAQAIALLQKANGKTSRTMISKSHSVFSKIVYIYIELMRQFYDIQRQYRVNDESQEMGYRFEPFDNTNIQPQVIDESVDMETGEPVRKFRKPIFDIKVSAEKQDPFSQAAQNAEAKELFGMGMFAPQRALEAQAALGMMNFEGIDAVKKSVQENNQIMQMLQMLQQENMKLKMIVQGTTGEDLGVEMPNQKGVAV